MRNYKELKVWERSRYFCAQIYITTSKYPKEEMYGITSQMRQSAISVSANIAEGCAKSSQKDFKRFLEIALGSALELENYLYLSLDLHFITEDKFELLMSELVQINKILGKFILTVKLNT